MIARAINDHGQILVLATNQDAFTQTAYVWQDGRVRNLGTPPRIRDFDDDPEYWANALNDQGQVSGGVQELGWIKSRAFLWRNGRETNLGNLGGKASSAYISAVNNNGQMVGTRRLPSGIWEAVLWRQGHIISLGKGIPAAINGQGMVAGNTDDHVEKARVWVWQKGARTFLGDPTDPAAHASAMNEQGQVIGGYTNLQQEGRAAIWENGQLYDLNRAITAGSGWILRSANGINSAGQIVGNGQYRGDEHAYLLTPVAKSKHHTPK